MSLLPTRSPGIVARRHDAVLGAALAAASAIALAPAAALAADASADARNDTPVGVDGVTVTAQSSGYAGTNALSKLPTDLQDVPQSVTVLNHNLLQSQGVSSLSDALRNMPGITIGGAEGGQIGNNINLNGFTARTDIFMDGFRDRGQYYRDTFALDSVEVLMGPSSMRFGRGSTGGAINQVSKLPTLTAQTDGTASVTSNGLARATLDINDPLSPTSALRIDVMAQNGAPTTRKDMTVK